MSEEQPAPGKPTYRELWYDVGGTPLDIWEGRRLFPARFTHILLSHHLSNEV